jgi:hypothetical protein
MKALLIALPYAGLVLSTVSVIWGLTQEPYTKDETNKRHLTKAGKYSIAFTLLGLFISLNTGVLKAVTDNQELESAKQEAARKEQEAALKDLARQQQEESRAQGLRDEARKTQEKIDQEAQKRRDEDLFHKQRDIGLAQQQLRGFSEAESAARQRTMNLLQRSNNILRDVRRTQYPFSGAMRLSTTLRLSWDHPQLKELSRLIEAASTRAPASTLISLYGDKDDIDINLSKDFDLFKPIGGMPEILRSPYLMVSIYERGRNDLSSETPPDIRIIYVPDVVEGEKPGEGIGLYTLRYFFKSRSYLIEAPPVTIEPATLSTGRITSVLALPGTTLVVGCGALGLTGCEHLSLESLNMEIPSGWQVVIDGKSFKRLTIKGREVFVHTFDPDEEKFIEKYSLFARH